MCVHALGVYARVCLCMWSWERGSEGRALAYYAQIPGFLPHTQERFREKRESRDLEREIDRLRGRGRKGEEKKGERETETDGRTDRLTD